jgi:hypothetical protein
MNAYKIVALKVGDEWVLDVLGVPFHSVDSDGEYFTERTQTHADRYTNPLILYYHSFTEDGRPQGEPITIGKATSIEKKSDGWWYRVSLDKTKEYAKRIWDAAQKGLAAASSGSIAHVARAFQNGKLVPYAKGMGGEIGVWPVVELSLIDIGEGRAPANSYAVAMPVAKARYEQAGETLPDDIDADSSEGDDIGAASAAAQRSEPAKTAQTNEDGHVGDSIMDEKEVQQAVSEAVAAALKARDDAAQAEADRQAEIAAAVKAAEGKKDEEFAKIRADEAEERRLPGGAPTVAKFANTWKYDNLETGDLALMHEILSDAEGKTSRHGASENAAKALAVRIAESDNDGFGETRQAMKMAGMPLKANELNQSTLASFGDEWIGVTYSTSLWERIRQDTPVVGRIPTVVVPQGSESIVIPLESTPPTFYLMSQASAQAANPGAITRTVTTSKMGTASKTLTVAKLGAATYFTGELEEDSLIPWVQQLRMMMEQEAAEVLEHVVIDGDTDTSATTNINDIGGTPGGTEAFLLFNGFRKSCLVTTTANSRDGGVLAVEDYLETLKLLGLAGKNALPRDRAQVAFIQDLWTGWKSLELTEVKTQDVYAMPTVENGQLTSIWGRDVITTANMHRANTDATYGYKANTAGKVDLDTAANNTTGAILAVRFDQWMLGYKRRIKIETQRVPSADSTEIVATMRVGLAQRDTEASAISYNLTV